MARRVGAWVVGLAATGLWWLEMALVDRSKPGGIGTNPLTRGYSDHAENVAWAQHLFWFGVAPFVGAGLGALAAGREPKRGLRALSASIGALLLVLVAGVVGIYVVASHVRFVF